MQKYRPCSTYDDEETCLGCDRKLWQGGGRARVQLVDSRTGLVERIPLCLECREKCWGEFSLHGAPAKRALRKLVL